MSEAPYGYSDDEISAAASTRLEDAERVRAAFSRAFETDDGQVVLEFLRRFCHHTQASYIRGDTHETAYLEGRRSVLLLVMKYMNLDDEQLLQLSKNQAQRRLRN